MPGLRVLLVDDSLLFREILARELISYLPAASSIITAATVLEARDKIISFDPDVMVLDVEMPQMDGIEFLRRLMPQYPQPTIMLSASDRYRDKALAAGASAFMTKPAVHILKAGQAFFTELANKICQTAITPLLPVTAEKHSLSKKIIAIGASTGGTEALTTVLTNLLPPLPGIVIVQHIPPMFSRLFADRLDSICSLSVKEASGTLDVLPNQVLIAPGDRHLKVKKYGSAFIATCTSGPRVNGHCPSADVLFDSVAAAAGAEAIGIILTGMGADGARGLLAMRQAGARTIGQDEMTSVVYGMPRSAWEIGAVETQLPLQAISGKIRALLNEQ